MAAVTELQAVQSQLEKARQDLRHVEEGIKKTSVRDPAYGFGDRLGYGGRGGRRGGGMVRPQRMFQREESPPKHKISSVASRLGPVLMPKKEEEEDEEEDTPTLKSTVIQSVGNNDQGREAAVPNDKATVQRSRRLFGSLLMGTLKQFKQDKEKTKDIEDKQAVVLDKIQKKEVEQKVQTQQERKKLFQCKDGVKDEIRLLEEQMTVTEMKLVCEEERDKLVKFIQTKAHPPVFYLPKEHTKRTEQALKDSTVRVTESYSKRIAEFDNKLSVLKDRLESVQQEKDALVQATSIKEKLEKSREEEKEEKENEKEKKANKETGIKIEVQLREKKENGHAKESRSKDKKRRHSTSSTSEKEEDEEKKRRNSTASTKEEKRRNSTASTKEEKRRNSTASAKEDKRRNSAREEVVTKSSSESESESESSEQEEVEEKAVKKSKKESKRRVNVSPRQRKKKSSSTDEEEEKSKKKGSDEEEGRKSSSPSPRKKSKRVTVSPRKRPRRGSSKGKEE